MLSRRRLLTVGLGGAALLSIGGGTLRWLSGGYRLAPGEAAIGLSVKELCVVRAVVDALVPGGDGLPSGIETGVVQRIDEQAWAADEGVRSDLRAGLQLLEHVPPLLGRSGRFSSLERATRLDVLRELLVSPYSLLSQIALSLKQLVALVYYSEDATWNAIGYDGPWLKTGVARPPESSIRYAGLLASGRGNGA